MKIDIVIQSMVLLPWLEDNPVLIPLLVIVVGSLIKTVLKICNFFLEKHKLQVESANRLIIEDPYESASKLDKSNIKLLSDANLRQVYEQSRKEVRRQTFLRNRFKIDDGANGEKEHNFGNKKDQDFALAKRLVKLLEEEALRRKIQLIDPT